MPTEVVVGENKSAPLTAAIRPVGASAPVATAQPTEKVAISDLVAATVDRVGIRAAFNGTAFEDRGEKLPYGFSSQVWNINLANLDLKGVGVSRRGNGVPALEPMQPMTAINGNTLNYGAIDRAVFTKRDDSVSPVDPKIEAGLRAKGMDISSGVAIIANPPYQVRWATGEPVEAAQLLAKGGGATGLVVLGFEVFVPPAEARDYGLRLSRTVTIDIFMSERIYSYLQENIAGKDTAIAQTEMKELLIEYTKKAFPDLYREIEQSLKVHGKPGLENMPMYDMTDLKK